MKRLLILLVLTGCSEPMTNDKVIAEVRKCEQANMYSEVWRERFWDGNVTNVYCLPKTPRAPGG